jgi:hypothetical protein
MLAFHEFYTYCIFEKSLNIFTLFGVSWVMPMTVSPDALLLAKGNSIVIEVLKFVRRFHCVLCVCRIGWLPLTVLLLVIF